MLGSPHVVKFVVRRIDCGFVGRFNVRGHAGVNRIRFKGRIHGHKLAPGVYRLRGRVPGKTVLRKTLVVGNGIAIACGGASPLREIVALFSGGSATGGSTSVAGSTSTGAAGGTSRHEGGSATSKAMKAAHKSAAPKRSGLLGTRASKVLPGSGGAQLALLLVLGAAILLLGLGALPREVVPHPAVAGFLAERRALLAAGGLGALVAFLISYFVT